MKKFIVRWSQRVTQDYEAVIEAESEEKAEELLMSGEVDGDLVETFFDNPAEDIQIDETE